MAVVDTGIDATHPDLKDNICRKPGTDEYIKWETEMNEMRGKAEVIVAKQRHGPTGTVSLAFQGEFTRFSDLAEDQHLPERFE